MEQFITFIINNWLLWLAFAAVLAMLITYEMQSKSGGIKMLSPQEAVLLMNKQQAFVVDVRDGKSYTNGHIIGATNTTLQEFEQKIKRYAKYKSKPVLVYCNVGQQTAKFANGLKKLGFEQVYGLKGGIHAWVNANLPLNK